MPDSKSHIAHILPWPTVGGTELATLRICQALRQEFRHTAFCNSGPSPVRELFTANGFETVEYEQIEPSYRHPGPFLAAARRLAGELKRRKVDLIHCSDLLGAYYAGFAGKIARLPVLSHVRCSYPKISRRDKTFLAAVNKFVFVSENARETFDYRVSGSRGVVVYDGMEVPDSLPENGLAPTVRAELNIPENALIVGMVARVTPAKDYATLAKAAKQVIASHPAVRFLIVGDYSLVPLNRKHYQEVKSMLADLGLERYFVFTDHRDDVDRMIRSMDIFVLSTHTEGLPLVILEAMAHGKPVVATAVGGVPEVVTDGKTGLLHEHENVAQLTSQLVRLIEDENKRRDFGKAGQQLATERFTVSSFANGMTKVYREML